MRSRWYSLFLLLLLVTSGCSDFLDVEPRDQLSRDEALSTLVGVRATLLGAYDALGRRDGYYRSPMIVYPELAGNIEPNPNAVSGGDIAGSDNARIITYRELYSFAVDPSYIDNQLATLYREPYQVLYIANDLIAALPELTEGSEAERNSLLGEALMLRALAHFDLVRLYAQAPGFMAGETHPGIALVTEPTNALVYRARATVAAVYDQIEADLLAAAELIGPAAQRTSAPIWLSRAAAHGLLARMYAYRQNWPGVIGQVNAALAATTRTLTPSARYVSAWTDGTLEEMLFEIDLQTYAVGGFFVGNYIGAGAEDPPLRISGDLLDLFEPDDLRRQLYVPNDKGDLVTLKYPETPATIGNIPYLRLSELYLLRAEAYAELGQDEAARADYDRIHQRAVPAAAPTILSGQALLDEILRERRRELALEGHLLFDLSRRGRPIERNDCLPFVTNCDLAYPDHRFVLPIPVAALEANPELVQNEGY